MRHMFTLSSIAHWLLGNLAFNLVCTVVIAVLARCWVALFGKPLEGWRKQLAFWALAVTTVFILLVLSENVFNASSGEEPHLRATIDIVNFGTLPAPDNRLYVIPAITIRNTGAPSIAERFSLLIRLPGGLVAPGVRYALPEKFGLIYSNGGTEEITAAQAIDLRSSQQPIPKGGLVRGRDMYVFPGLTESQIRNAVGIVYEITFFDALGNAVTGVSEPTAGASAEILSLPGLTQLGQQQSQNANRPSNSNQRHTR
jgi:type IV secretory pathway VirB2 component (pilin)